MMRVGKEKSGVWREMKGVLLEVVKLPVHNKLPQHLPRLPPAVGERNPILARDVPTLGCKFGAIRAVVAGHHFMVGRRLGYVHRQHESLSLKMRDRRGEVRGNRG